MEIHFFICLTQLGLMTAISYFSFRISTFWKWLRYLIGSTRSHQEADQCKATVLRWGILPSLLMYGKTLEMFHFQTSSDTAQKVCDEEKQALQRTLCLTRLTYYCRMRCLSCRNWWTRLLLTIKGPSITGLDIFTQSEQSHLLIFYSKEIRLQGDVRCWATLH